MYTNFISEFGGSHAFTSMFVSSNLPLDFTPMERRTFSQRLLLPNQSLRIRKKRTGQFWPQDWEGQQHYLPPSSQWTCKREGVSVSEKYVKKTILLPLRHFSLIFQPYKKGLETLVWQLSPGQLPCPTTVVDERPPLT